MRPRQTSHKPKKRHKNRILWLSTTMVVLFVLSIFGLKSSIPTALAMEQATRCGLEEHVHDDDCYIDNVIICQQKAHSHSSNCYLLLLEDNDINMLLTAVSQAEDKNLESLIAGVLGEAVRLNDMSAGEELMDISDSAVPLSSTAGVSDSAVMTASFRGTTYAGTEVSQLNNIIDTFALEPAMVLNEGMAVPMEAEESDSSNDGIMAAAVQPSKDTYKANIYIYLDEKWQCVDNTKEFSVSDNGWGTYTRYISAGNLTSYVNAKIDSDFTTNLSASNWKYNVESKSSTPNADSDGNNIVFGTYWIYGDTKGPIHLYLYNNNAAGTVMNFYTVTVIDINGNSTSYIYSSGTRINLDSSYNWEKTVDNVTTAVTETEYANATKTFRAVPKTCTVTYHYPDGTTSTESVPKGSTITLDPDYIWRKGSSTGTVVLGPETITSDTHYYASSVFTLRYDVSFDRPSGTSTGTSPTLQGTAVTTISDTYDKEQGQTTATIRRLSSTEVACPVSGNGVGLTRISYFAGWKVENTETILSPRTTLTWQELKAYDTNGDGVVNLTGQWETHAKQTASFYIRLDSVAVDINGNIQGQGSENYTNELFSTHVGGNFSTDTDSGTLTTQYGVADKTADNSYTADQNIRKLAGNYSGNIWLYDFPNDEDMFAEIPRQIPSGKSLTVNGEVVDLSKLNSNYYAIRWYVFKCQDDAWHIDGKLVKKEGVIHVDKTFAGNETLIERSKEDFYITAENAEKNKFYIMTLEGLFDWEKPRHPAYREGATFLTPVDDDDGNDDTYLWEIDNVTHAEVWTVTEFPMELSEAADYSEWMVVDSTATNAETSGAGTTVSITGVTHATDIDHGEYLSVEFNNIYYRGNSLMLKKEDKKTGKALAGAAFQLYQNDTLMTFRYDEENGLYIYDPRGTFSTLECDGYVNLSTTGFAYDYGPITVKEVKTPDGYNPIDDIVIGYTEDTNGDGVADSTVGILNTEISLGYAEYNNGLLIVKNSSDPIDITVEKIWNCDESEWADVKIELLANGSLNLAATLLADSGASPYVTLMAENQYTHTWYGLPASANNDPVRWTIRETKIGTENCKADYSFANWITSYSAPRTDENGDVYLSVTNTPTRPMLYLIKTDWSETLLLQGAQFRIIEVNSSGVEVGTEKILTTNENGALLFDNLKHETRYKLTEVSAPEGYWPYAEEVYLTIAQGGIITLEGDSEYVSAGDTAYQIQVKNRSSMPMPETGGNGTLLFTGLGMLMLFGVFTYQKKNARRKRRRGARRTSR